MTTRREILIKTESNGEKGESNAISVVSRAVITSFGTFAPTMRSMNSDGAILGFIYLLLLEIIPAITTNLPKNPR